VVVVGFGSAGAPAAIGAHDAGANVLLLEKMPEGKEGGSTRIAGGNLIPATAAQYRSRTFNLLSDEEATIYSQGMQSELDWLLNSGLEVNETTYPGTTMKSFQVPLTGGITGAPKLWSTIKSQVSAKGIKVLYQTAGEELIQAPDTKEVLGIIAEIEGRKVNIKANRGVVLTTGNYAASQDMLNRLNYSGLEIRTTTSPANTGDGQKMGMKAGARLYNIGGEIPSNCAIQAPSEQYGTGFHWIAPKPNFIIVDKYGKRFINEGLITGATPLTGFISAYYPANDEYRHVPFWAVFDRKLIDNGPVFTNWRGWAIVEDVYQWSSDNSAEIAKGWIVQADTIAELASKMKAKNWIGGQVTVQDTDALVETTNSFNEYCANGKDLEFGRTNLGPLDTPPFYAMALCPLLYYTRGGLEHNIKGQTIGQDGKPILRLYSAGDVGQVSITMSEGILGAMACGRIAGKNAAAETPWS
jgi:hypothetical protein